MSGKIKAKDLQYDSSLPPFLQRLHAQKAGRGDTDRHNQQIARPKRAKDANEDDGPTMVDESGETMSKDEYEKLTKSGDVGGNVQGEVADEGEAKVSGGLPEVDRKDVVKTTTAIGAKKRKSAKIVGDQGNDEDEASSTAKEAGSSSLSEKKAKAPTKPKKKAKPIKLAFDDAEEG